METTDEILFRNDGALGRATLNRPQALNALTPGMCASLAAKLEEWAADPTIKAVALEGAPGRAFSAGADIRLLAEWGKAGDPRAAEFFATEYRLNAAIKYFPKPVIALLGGIVMGGGAGLSVHGSHRVACETTLFAMPETAIGFLPDVGASYFLSRLPGALGMYLALTGARLNGADMLSAGLATHYAPQSRFPDIAASLARGADPDAVLGQFSADAGHPPLLEARDAIDRCFGASTVEDVIAALETEGQWGYQTVDLIAAGSPLSTRLAFRAIEKGANLDLVACLAMEYRVVQRILQGHDYYEGVRARLIDKDGKPQWKPARLKDVSDEEVESFFSDDGAGDLALDLNSAPSHGPKWHNAQAFPLSRH